MKTPGWIKAKPWNGKDLKGEWQFTLKLDGVRAFLTPQGAYSRNGKPLYNLGPHLPSAGHRDVEVFVGSFKETIQRVRSHDHQDIPGDALYDLDPLDPRLADLGHIVGQPGEPVTGTNPTAAHIRECMQIVVDLGYEGLVLRQGTKWIKIKPHETHDVRITAFLPGTGKHLGRLGALMTEMGKVGTGFSDAERQEIWDNRANLLHYYVEVESQHLTPGGKFRFPRFKRMRYDK